MSNEFKCPPGFNHNNLPMSIIEYEYFDEHGKIREASVMVFKDMPVHEDLHANYWEAYDNFGKVLDACKAAGAQQPATFFLLDSNQKIQGAGHLPPAADVHQLAWLACLFGEMHQWYLGLNMPEGALPPADYSAPAYLVPLREAA